MAFLDDLKNKIGSYFNEPYKITSTKIVPGTDLSKFTFGNTAIEATLSFLFVDIRKSSKLHETYGLENAARIYQSFHDICLRIIEKNNGEIRAFDGDRIMGVFSGDRKNTNAVKAAMKIRWAVKELINKRLKNKIAIGCGVESGKILITKVGKGRDINTNDLVWVGKACNYAAHLSQNAYDSILISNSVYKNMLDETRYSTKDGEKTNMWISTTIKLKSGKEISVCKSNWRWSI